MKHTNAFHVFAPLFSILVAGCATSPAVDVPQALKPAANQSLAMVVKATGVQIYECRASKDATGYEWAFVAPEAKLFDARGQEIGSHGAGPHWQARDGSRVVGAAQARADSPSPGAIPWLLLSAKSTGPDGAFSKVTSVQRVNTVGGVAPVTPCTREIAGRSARVDYTADYRFFALPSDSTYSY
jgi:hypothetical protein